MVLDKSVPVCGDQTGVDYEALLRVKPTHVLIEWGAREIPARLRDMADRNGWVLQDFAQLTLDDVLDTTSRLGTLFCRSEPAKFVELSERMKQAWSTKHTPINAGRILLLESIDPPAALGPGSFHHQMLERIGGSPAIASGNPYMRLEIEDILRMAPDGIILFAPGSATTADARTQLGRIGALDIPATRNGRIAIINDPLCLTPSSALLPVTEQMERTLKGWQP
jgi:ABC-type hemin transport system substrate-binding protein